MASGVCTILAIFNEELRGCASILQCVSNFTYLITQGCMDSTYLLFIQVVKVIIISIIGSSQFRIEKGLGYSSSSSNARADDESRIRMSESASNKDYLLSFEQYLFFSIFYLFCSESESTKSTHRFSVVSLNMALKVYCTVSSTIKILKWFKLGKFTQRIIMVISPCASKFLYKEQISGPALGSRYLLFVLESLLIILSHSLPTPKPRNLNNLTIVIVLNRTS